MADGTIYEIYEKKSFNDSFTSFFCAQIFFVRTKALYGSFTFIMPRIILTAALIKVQGDSEKM